MGFFAPPIPRVLAHRGLALDAPENTLLAFRRAVDAGAVFIETDVHATSDGVAVIAHDPDLQRAAGLATRLRDLTLADLRMVDLGQQQVSCTLEEALHEFPATRFNIDVKAADAIDGTVAAIVAAGAIDRVLVTSFSERRRAAVVRLLPGVATSASARRFIFALVAAHAGFNHGVRYAMRGIDAVQVPERALGMRVTTDRVIQAFHRAGVEVHVWTINDPIRMAQLLDLGIDGIVTDRADLALGLVNGCS